MREKKSERKILKDSDHPRRRAVHVSAPHLDELLAQVDALRALARDELRSQTESLGGEWLRKGATQKN